MHEVTFDGNELSLIHHYACNDHVPFLAAGEVLTRVTRPSRWTHLDKPSLVCSSATSIRLSLKHKLCFSQQNVAKTRFGSSPRALNCVFTRFYCKISIARWLWNRLHDPECMKVRHGMSQFCNLGTSAEGFFYFLLLIQKLQKQPEPNGKEKHL